MSSNPLSPLPSMQAHASELFIDIPLGDVRGDKGRYRLDYKPPQGNPRPNSTFTPLEVSRGLKLTHVQPGMRYDFVLYYSNFTIDDVATWTASISTGERVTNVYIKDFFQNLFFGPSFRTTKRRSSSGVSLLTKQGTYHEQNGIQATDYDFLLCGLIGIN